MRRSIMALAAALLIIPGGLATASLLHRSNAVAGINPQVFVLKPNDAARYPGASVRCTAIQRRLLMCGTPSSKIYVQISNREVTIFRAGANSVFKKLYSVRR